MKASSTSFAFFALLCSGLLLAACDSASDAQKPQLRIASQQTSSAAVGDSATTASGDTVVFRAVEPEVYENPPPPVAVDVADDGRLHIGGFFFAFTLSAKLEGKIDRDDNTIRIDIRAVAPESYPRMPLLTFYDAHVTDLPPGTYELRVTHEGDIFQNDKKERVTTMVQKTVEVQ